MRSKFTWILTLFLAFMMHFSYGQEKTITGNVSAASDGLPLPGVSVVVQGTTRGVQTDFDGNYSINASVGERLVFSYVGMSDQVIPVGAANTINVVLQEDTEALEEVVVVAYGTKTQDQLSSAVSVVGSEELAKLTPTTSVDNMLQGRAPGVQVVAANGNPSSTAFVRIRGIGSINAGSAPLYVIDGVVAPNLTSVNPNDVESMSVLKDAATASLYGARAANGVIVITTKQGRKNQGAQISFTSRYGKSQKIEDNFEIMNARQKLQYESELAALGVGNAAALPGATTLTDEEYQLLLSYDQDWRDTLLRQGTVQSNALSIAGGSEEISYFLSVGHDRNTGIIDGLNGFERLSGRLNVTYQAKPWLEIGANVSVTGTNTDEPRDRNNVQNPFRAMYDYNPYETLFQRDAQGNVLFDENGEPLWNWTHTGFQIAEAIRTNPEQNLRTTTIGGLNVKAKLTEHITNDFRIGAQYNIFRREYFIEPGSRLDFFVGDAQNPGSKTDNGSFVLDYTVTNILSYERTIADKHNFKVSGLFEYNDRNFRSYRLSSIGFASPLLDVQAVAASPTTTTTNVTRTTLYSLGGFLDYDYDGKYILTGSIRRDGSSDFGQNFKFGTFWSASAAWNISRESFMEDSFINQLKLRASAGTSGNRNVGNLAALAEIGFGNLNGATTAIPTDNGNPDLRWEENFIWDIGLEFGLWNNRIRGVVDYYERTTSDLLLNVQLPRQGGEPDGVILSNIGEMVNKGIEVELSGDIFRGEDFEWTLGGNIAFVDNEVTELNPSTANPEGAPIDRSLSTIRVGEEINTFYMPRWAGVNPANGEPLFLDANGNVTNQYDADANQVLSGKSPLADFDGGVNTYIRYKGFDLAADFYFKVGNYVYNFIESNLLSDGTAVDDNQRVDAFNYWRNPGDTGVLPSPLFGNEAQQFTDRFLQKGDYIRLRNLTVGYNMPSKFLENTGLQSVRFFVQGQNLWSYVPYFKGDPEVGVGSGESANPVFGEFNLYSYPQVQSIQLGVDVKF